MNSCAQETSMRERFDRIATLDKMGTEVRQ